MNMFKRMIALATLVAMFSANGNLNAQGDFYYAGGNGYQEYRSAPSIGPAVALGTIALIAIIAVAVQNSNNEHSHSH